MDSGNKYFTSRNKAAKCAKYDVDSILKEITRNDPYITKRNGKSL